MYINCLKIKKVAMLITVKVFVQNKVCYQT